MDTPIIETPVTPQEQFSNGEETPPTEAPQVTEGTPPASEDGNETPPAPNGSETEDGFETPPAPTYYTPEEMKTLQVDGIDTSRIPPEMVPLYQAMQSPITRKSQELSTQLKALEQGTPPLQDNQPQAPHQAPQPSIDEIAVNMTMQKLGIQQKPEPWDANYESYMLEVGDVRRDLKDSVNRRGQAMNELNTFKSGFTPEQFKTIDAQAETKMYKLLSDPSTQAEGQRIQRAMQTGDTKTILAYVKTVAKEVLTATPNANPTRSTPPVTTTPHGAPVNTGKDPSKMTNDEYRAYRNSQS